MTFDTVTSESESLGSIPPYSPYTLYISANSLQLQRAGCGEAIGCPVRRVYAHRRAACPSADTGMPVPIPSFEQSAAVRGRIQGRSMSVYWSRSCESVLRPNLRLWMFVWELQLGDIVTCRDSDWKPIKASLKGPWYSNRVDPARWSRSNYEPLDTCLLWWPRWSPVKNSLLINMKSASCHNFIFVVSLARPFPLTSSTASVS